MLFTYLDYGSMLVEFGQSIQGAQSTSGLGYERSRVGVIFVHSSTLIYCNERKSSRPMFIMWLFAFMESTFTNDVPQ